MHTFRIPAKEITRRNRWLIASAALAWCLALPQPAHAGEEGDVPANVPASLQVPPGNQVFLVGHAVGVQIYTCTDTGWSFVAPAATLFDDDTVGSPMEQFAIHFAGPTWQANDRSTVTGKKIASAPAHSPKAIPWLLLSASMTTMGRLGGDTLTGTTYIQRINTRGGLAPASGCDAMHIGAYAGVPYRATYYFYKAD